MSPRRAIGALFVACFALACGTDPPSEGPRMDVPDAAAPDSAPANPCWDQSLMLPCCYSRSNADRLDHPQLKLVGMAPTLPEAFMDPGTTYGVTQALRLDALPFGFAVEGAAGDGPVSITIGGFSPRTEGGTPYYEWRMGDAAGPGEASRWDPRTTTGVIADDTLSSEPTLDEVVAPVFDTDGSVPVELHMRELAFDNVALTHERTCIGAYDTEGLGSVLGAGRITGFLPVEPARVGALPIVRVSFCELFAGVSCDEPQSAWPHPPDSLCDASGCSVGGCTPEETCNAWRLESQIGAAGVEIR